MDNEKMAPIKQVSNIKEPEARHIKRRQVDEVKAKLERKKDPKHLPKSDLYSIEAYYKKLQILADSVESRKDVENESDITSKKESNLQLTDKEMGRLKQVSNIKRPGSPRIKRRQADEEKAKLERKKVAKKQLPKNDVKSLRSMLVF